MRIICISKDFINYIFTYNSHVDIIIINIENIFQPFRLTTLIINKFANFDTRLNPNSATAGSKYNNIIVLLLSNLLLNFAVIRNNYKIILLYNNIMATVSWQTHPLNLIRQTSFLQHTFLLYHFTHGIYTSIPVYAIE